MRTLLALALLVLPACALPRPSSETPRSTVQTPADVRQAAIYDSLRALPPGSLSDRDLAWMQIYQRDRQVDATAVEAREANRSARSVTALVIGLVSVSLYLALVGAQ